MGEGDSCAARGHEAVSLKNPVGKARLWEEVWGPDSRARKLRQAAKVGAGGGLVGALGDGCAGLDIGGSAIEACSAGDLGAGILAALVGIILAAVVAVVSVVLFWVLKALVTAFLEWLDKPKPHGALLAPPRAPRQRNGSGRVKSTAAVELPWTNGRAVAYAFELHRKKLLGGGAFLRDAETAGFDVEMTDGRVVRVPAGRLRILGGFGRESFERDRLDGFVRGLTLGGDPRESAQPLFPYDDLRTLIVAPGDEVEVLGELTATADAGSAHAYRASAGVLVPVGVPVIRARQQTPDGGARPVRVAAEAALSADSPRAHDASGEGEGPSSEDAGRSAGA